MMRGAAPAVLMITLVAGCSTSSDEPGHDASSSPAVARAAASSEPEGPVTTLSWDLVDLEGNVVEIDDRRAENCRTDHCPRGVVTISDVVAATASGDRVPTAETRFVITDDTRLFGCGPTDGREPITLTEFFDRHLHVVGEIPVAIWTIGGVDGEPPDPVRARQVVVGSCG